MDYASKSDVQWVGSIPDTYRVFHTVQNKQKTIVIQNTVFQEKDLIEWTVQSQDPLVEFELHYHQWLLSFETERVVDIEDAISAWMDQFPFEAKHSMQVAWHPFVVSQRIRTWIELLRTHGINSGLQQEMVKSLYQQGMVLRKNFEFHLGGNHLLENAISLYQLAIVTEEKEWLDYAREQLKKELDAQILDNGAHYELCTMYHGKILDSLINTYLLAGAFGDDTVQTFLTSKIQMMSSFYTQLCDNKTEPPLFNDSNVEECIPLDIIQTHLKEAGLAIKEAGELRPQFYTFKGARYECLFDVSNVESSYIGGHTHADSLQFLLYTDSKPILVDPGSSSYHDIDIRNKERHTRSHNTLGVGAQPSSEVWSKFRLGARANTKVVEENTTFVRAYHDGYERSAITHQRSIQASKNQVQILDEALGKTKQKLFLSFHCHPDTDFRIDENTQLTNGDIALHFEGEYEIYEETYDYALGFNKRAQGKRFVVEITDRLLTTIDLKR